MLAGALATLAVVLLLAATLRFAPLLIPPITRDAIHAGPLGWLILFGLLCYAAAYATGAYVAGRLDRLDLDPAPDDPDD